MIYVWQFAISFFYLMFHINTVNGVEESQISVIDENGSLMIHEVMSDSVIRLPSNSYIGYKKPNNFKNSTKILFWSPLYSQRNNWFWWFSPDSTKDHCPDLDCKFTIDKNELNSSDAVVFHVYAENLHLHRNYANFTSQFPVYRLPHQRWVYYTNEPPSTHSYDQSAVDGLFNWTMTYRLDSDVVVHYGKLILNTLSTLEERTASWERNFVSGKNKLVVWMVSHCPTEGNREAYVKEMQKYASVDIFGNCGPLKCKPFPSRECFNKLNTEYKFYLAFENVLAKDYVTEKLIQTLAYDVVPVVFGGADYSHFAPLGSYINALDFDSPEHLVKYLQFLDQNDVEYNKYFDWKRGYSTPVVLKHTLWICDFCLRLMNPNVSVKVYDDMNDWWNKQGQANSWTPIANSEL